MAGKIALGILGVILCYLIIMFVIYWFNLDMKKMRRKYDDLMAYYDQVERDKRI